MLRRFLDWRGKSSSWAELAAHPAVALLLPTDLKDKLLFPQAPFKLKPHLSPPAGHTSSKLSSVARLLPEVWCSTSSAGCKSSGSALTWRSLSWKGALHASTLGAAAVEASLGVSFAGAGPQHQPPPTPPDCMSKSTNQF